MKWSDVFEDADDVGQSEYGAIVEVIANAVFHCEEWQLDRDRELTDFDTDYIKGILMEFEDWARVLREKLAPAREESNGD